MSKIVRLYLTSLQKHPWKTQIFSTGILMGCGDLISQFAVEKKTLVTFDRMRSARFFIYGFIITGPALRGWYMFLDKVVKGSGSAATLKKVAMDQLIFAPAFCSTFIFNMGLCRTMSVEQATQQVKQDFPPVIRMNYKIWPAVQLINFYFVPLQHRVLVVNVVALLWNTFLAWTTESAGAKEQLIKCPTVEQ